MIAALGSVMVGVPVLAADREAGRKVDQANRAVAAGRYDDAIKTYDEVGQKLPDSPELAYNRGVAYYRKGDRTKAAECFEKSLATRDIALETRAKFNLGNCAYADALDKQGNLKEALEKLRVAIAHYKDVIVADPNNHDAKVNIETAQLLMKHLLDQEKKKQEEQKKKNPQSQPESQPESQPASQPESPPQSQPASQPQSDKQQENKDGEKKDGQEKQGQKLEGQNSQDGKEKKEEQAQAAPAQMREMSKEEAEKVLQQIRDRERQRREGQLRLLRSRQTPVDKDW